MTLRFDGRGIAGSHAPRGKSGLLQKGCRVMPEAVLSLLRRRCLESATEKRLPPSSEVTVKRRCKRPPPVTAMCGERQTPSGARPMVFACVFGAYKTGEENR